MLPTCIKDKRLPSGVQSPVYIKLEIADVKTFSELKCIYITQIPSSRRMQTVL